jgi:hypothetical protein
VRRVAICCLLAACGRLHFQEGAAGDAGTGDVSALCSRNASAPESLTISGATFRYMAFDNSQRTMVGGVAVSAFDGETRAELANATSDAMGRYTLSVPTGGTPRRLLLVYSLPSDFQTEVTIDRAFDRDVSGANAQVWTVGDGPLWNLAGMTSFYSAGGVARDTTKGTLNIAVRDCAGQPIGGVTVAVSPAPQQLRYQGDDGTLVNSGATLSKFATAFGFNAEPGINTITATALGYTFAPITVGVGGGSFNTLVVLHAAQ